MLANGKLLVTEFALVYGGPVSTLLGSAIAAYMVVWQVNVGNKDVRAEITRVEQNLSGEISRVEQNLSRRISGVEKKVDAVAQVVGGVAVRRELHEVAKNVKQSGRGR